MKITIRTDKTITAEYGAGPRLIADILREQGVSLSMPCSGRHVCGKCRVTAEGGVSRAGAEERRLLAGAPENTRLACCAYAVGDCTISLSQSAASIVSEGFLSRFTPNPMGKKYGFAVDIGTTTVAVYAYNLGTGALVGSDAFLNPQSVFGGDVISRIGASMSGSREKLAQLISGALEASFEKLCGRTGIPSGEFDAAVVTGNTTMLYLLLGKDVKCLSAAPFEIDDFLGRFVSAADCGFGGFPGMRVYLPRIMSSFVGSDITCSVISAVDLLRGPSASLLIDIGTNGEMAVLRDGKLYCCSTAAGPAFEGAGITMGSMAVNGAVNKVWLEGGEIRYTVLGGGKASGICGSGLIDAAAAFVSCGLIDETGCIDDTCEACASSLTEFGGQNALRIGDSGVLLTQKDIRAIQLAKSAVCAGIDSLCSACGVGVEQIERLVLAGGFGSFVDVRSAGKIGLIPQELTEKARAVGNAAGMGASEMLLSSDSAEEAAGLAAASETLDLSTSAYFMDRYVERMMF